MIIQFVSRGLRTIAMPQDLEERPDQRFGQCSQLVSLKVIKYSLLLLILLLSQPPTLVLE